MRLDGIGVGAAGAANEPAEGGGGETSQGIDGKRWQERPGLGAGSAPQPEAVGRKIKRRWVRPEWGLRSPVRTSLFSGVPLSTSDDTPGKDFIKANM